MDEEPIDPRGDAGLSFPRAELRTRTVRGVLVNAVFMGGSEVLAVAQGLIVTVLLGPQSIGLYGIVTTTAVTVAALRRVGIDEAFVQQREPDQEAEFQRAFTLELIVGGAFSLVLLVARPDRRRRVRRQPAGVADDRGRLPADRVRAAGADAGSSFARWTS